MQAHEAPATPAERAPIDAVRHIAQLLLITEPGTAASIDVRMRWAAQLHLAADRIEGVSSSLTVADARAEMEAAREALRQAVRPAAEELIKVGTDGLIAGTDMFAWHVATVALPDGRILDFEGTLQVRE